jgi:hypothetical protein
MEKGAENPEYKGQGSTYVIPADDVPPGIKSGAKGIMKFYGTINVDEQGATIQVDRIEFEELGSRDDPLQKQIEEGFDIELKISK